MNRQQRQNYPTVLVLCALLMVTALGCANASQLKSRTGTQSTAVVNNMGQGVAAHYAEPLPPRHPSAGKLLDLTPVPTVPAFARSVGVRAYKIVYGSTNGYSGEPSQVTGMVFVPSRRAPEGGWPIISYAHGSVGTLPRCSPSARFSRGSYSHMVFKMVKQGYVVAATDYEGLGGPGQHPYLDPVTEGFNTVDIVEATRAFVPSTSGKWASFGPSQGGQASWSAAEVSQPYLASSQDQEGIRDLELIASVATQPSTSRKGMVSMMVKGTLPPHQQLSLPMILLGLRLQFPDIKDSDYLHGPLRNFSPKLMKCGDNLEKIKVSKMLRPGDTRPVSPVATAELYGALLRRSLPQRSTEIPMFVAYGTKDTTIYPQWIVESLSSACDMGSRIQILVRKGQGHIDEGAEQAGLGFLEERFRGDPVRNDCRTLTSMVFSGK